MFFDIILIISYSLLNKICVIKSGLGHIVAGHILFAATTIKKNLKKIYIYYRYCLHYYIIA
jgi:hypothetical protein